MLDRIINWLGMAALIVFLAMGASIFVWTGGARQPNPATDQIYALHGKGGTVYVTHADYVFRKWRENTALGSLTILAALRFAGWRPMGDKTKP